MTACALVATFCLFAVGGLPADGRVCTVRELNDARFAESFTGRVTVTGVVCPNIRVSSEQRFILEDESGRTAVVMTDVDALPAPGTRVRVTCHRVEQQDHDKLLVFDKIEKIGTGETSAPRVRRLEDLDARLDDLYEVTTEGVVMDVFPDEIDSRFDILLLKDGLARLPVFLFATPTNETFRNARIRVTGQYQRIASGYRRFSGPLLLDYEKPVEVLQPGGDPFSAPPVDPSNFLTPSELALMDRRSLEGRVLATWDGSRLMLRVGGLVAHARLIRGQSLPPIGGRIRVVGYPQTDFYKIHLAKSVWKPLEENAAEPDERPESVSIHRIIENRDGASCFVSTYHGALITLTGQVRSPREADSPERSFYLETDGHQVPVNVSACPDVVERLVSGCEVRVTGRCRLDVDAWSPNESFPRLTGLTLLMRTADDLVIVRTPSWWTPARLITLVAVLAVLLLAFLVWNRLLQRLVERRGRELFDADVERAGESLRVEERTRIAIELHDTLSQNLTGVALQLNAGRYVMAAQALKSCREELRNCLWDLRSDAIDAKTMDEAIRRTLAPHLGGARLQVRFAVPREDLTDNTFYALVRIVRELTVNAIRHGKASVIRIAGSRETGRLLFSVRDNGCGFDPENHPGIAEGHFGLQGIRERIAFLNGTLTIDSRPGAGARVTVSLPIEHGKDSKE